MPDGLTPLQREESDLRERLAEVHRRYQDEAAPIIRRLVEIECMKPPKPLIVFSGPLAGMRIPPGEIRGFGPSLPIVEQPDGSAAACRTDLPLEGL